MKKLQYKYLVALALILSNVVIFFSNSIITPLLTTIARSLNIDVSISGMAGTITLILTGITLFLSNPIQKYLKPKWVVVFSLLFCMLSCVFVSFSTNFPMLLFFRAFTGIAMGFISFGAFSIITIWLPIEERGFYLAIQTAIVTFSSFFSARAAIPLMKLLNSWNGCFLVMAAACLAVLIIWLIIGMREPAQTMAPKRKRDSAGPVSVIEILKSRDVMVLATFMAIISCSHTAVCTYIAPYLELVRNFDVARAADYSGFLYLPGLLGGPVASLISAKLGLRKPVVFASTACSIVCMFLILKFEVALLLICVILGYGFFSSIFGPITQIMLTELRPESPEFSSTAYSFVFACGYFATLFTPVIMSIFSNLLSMQAGMYIFIIIYIISWISILFTKETGRKKRDNIS